MRILQNLVASDKSYALGIRGSTDNLEIAYKGDVDADLDDTPVTVTTGGNVTATGTGYCCRILLEILLDDLKYYRY